MAARGEAVAVVELVRAGGARSGWPRRARAGAARASARCRSGRGGRGGRPGARGRRRRARGPRPRTGPARRAARSGGRAPDGDEHVDAVQQRAGEPPVVAREVAGAAGAVVAAEPARARVRGRDEHEAGRERHHLLAAHDRHVAVLERLAQRLQRRPRELRQLVEEQDAVVGERRLARRRMGAAADEAGRRDRVVRRAERALRREPAAVVQAADRVDPGDLDRLARRSSAAGSTAAGGRASSCRCPAGRAGRGCGRPRRRPRAPGSGRCGRGRRRGPAARPPRALRRQVGGRRRLGVAAQERDGLLERRRRRAPPARGRAPPRAATPRGTRIRRRPWRRAPSAIASVPRTDRSSPLSASSPMTAQPSSVVRGELPAGDEQRDRERQVEARADLAQVGRREVDRDAAAAGTRSPSSRAPPAPARAPRARPCRPARRP